MHRAGQSCRTQFREENGYLESFNGKLREELLNGEIFDTLLEAQVLVERWRNRYNEVRPHSAREYRPPAPATIQSPPVAIEPEHLSCPAQRAQTPTQEVVAQRGAGHFVDMAAREAEVP